MTKLTLCDKVLVGDIPTYEIESEEDFHKTLNLWLDTKDFKKSVFVCFASLEDLEYRDNQVGILVTHSMIGIFEFFNNMNLSVICSVINMNLNVFEFESYEEAFKYCIDLKEGL